MEVYRTSMNTHIYSVALTNRCEKDHLGWRFATESQVRSWLDGKCVLLRTGSFCSLRVVFWCWCLIELPGMAVFRAKDPLNKKNSMGWTDDSDDIHFEVNRHILEPGLLPGPLWAQADVVLGVTACQSRTGTDCQAVSVQAYRGHDEVTFWWVENFQKHNIVSFLLYYTSVMMHFPI